MIFLVSDLRKRFEKELLEMDKAEKRLSVLKGCAQEHLVRQEAEELRARRTGSGEGSGDQVEDTAREREVNQEQHEYSDAMSTAVDEVIYR